MRYFFFPTLWTMQRKPIGLDTTLLCHLSQQLFKGHLLGLESREASLFSGLVWLISAWPQWTAWGSCTVCPFLRAARRLLLSGNEAASPSPLQPRGTVIVSVSCSDGSMSYYRGDYPVSQTALWSLQCMSVCTCVRQLCIALCFH